MNILDIIDSQQAFAEQDDLAMERDLIRLRNNVESGAMATCSADEVDLICIVMARLAQHSTYRPSPIVAHAIRMLNVKLSASHSV